MLMFEASEFGNSEERVVLLKKSSFMYIKNQRVAVIKR